MAHASHKAGPRGGCEACGARAGAAILAEPCPERLPRGAPVSLAVFLRLAVSETREFAAWWRTHAHPETLPSATEWWAEFLEWRKAKKR